MTTNHLALEGVTRCYCGSKYWEDDLCVDCGARPDLEAEAVRLLEQTIGADWRTGFLTDPGGWLAYVGAFLTADGETDDDAAVRFIDRIEQEQ
jgi:hypothetical protein